MEKKRLCVYVISVYIYLKEEREEDRASCAQCLGKRHRTKYSRLIN